jgi:hypothetical protein
MSKALLLAEPLVPLTERDFDILMFLRTRNIFEGATPLEIAKHIFGAKATTKQINPLLYSLEKSGYIRHQAQNPNGGNPRWYLVIKETTTKE